ncbi:MAG: transcriptional regulator [Flavobacteriales bacterium]|jgi:DNA-binding transcriptional ArsR family regulator|nr:transcriptional regulator [Flavobacteriales bacterium]
MNKLDPLLHQELRLAIISFLATVERADFKKLLEVTEATKGNLSVQISKLQDAKYIKVTKTFKGKYPHTQCAITPTGSKALEAYVMAIKNLLNL